MEECARSARRIARNACQSQKFFPPYFAAPVVRQDTLTKYPEISQTLNKLAGKIDDQRMAALNAEVTEQKKEANEVARAYLKSQGLIK